MKSNRGLIAILAGFCLLGVAGAASARGTMGEAVKAARALSKARQVDPRVQTFRLGHTVAERGYFDPDVQTRSVVTGPRGTYTMTRVFAVTHGPKGGTTIKPYKQVSIDWHK
jgi:hypothetical protein